KPGKKYFAWLYWIALGLASVAVLLLDWKIGLVLLVFCGVFAFQKKMPSVVHVLFVMPLVIAFEPMASTVCVPLLLIAGTWDAAPVVQKKTNAYLGLLKRSWPVLISMVA